MKIEYTNRDGSEVLHTTLTTRDFNPPVPRVGDDVEIKEEGYTVSAVVWAPMVQLVQVRLR